MAGFRRIKRGEHLPGIHADSWNGFVDAAQKVSGLIRTPIVTGNRLVPADARSVIMVRNDTEDDVERFHALSIMEGPVWEPVTNEERFFDQVVFKGTEPDGNGNWVVLLEDCRPGEVVPAVISGITHCYVEASDQYGFENLGWCDTTDNGVVEATLGGMGRILYRSTRTADDGLAIIELSQRPFCPIVVVQLEERMLFNTATDATLLTFPDGSRYSGSPIVVEAWNLDVAGGAEFADNAKMACKYVYRGSDPSKDFSYLRMLNPFECPEY